MQPQLNFIIEHREQAGRHYIKFIPAKPCEGYPPKEVEIEQFYWDVLKYHFMTAVDDKNKTQKLSYI